MIFNRYKKRTFLIFSLLLFIPLFFILVPKHTFMKKLHSGGSTASKENTASDSVETVIDRVPLTEVLSLTGADGPYIIQKKNKTVLVNVVPTAKGFKVTEEKIKNKLKHQFTCQVDNIAKDQFTFQLRKAYEIPAGEYVQPKKLLAISDFEGNFDAFYSLLIANNVMDTAYHWTFGEGHLVIAGDMMDRGVNVTQCLWLIYKLEQAAEKVGGQVHFILGNHEVMNLQGVINYVEPKYLALAIELSGDKNPRNAYLSLMSQNQELVKWMQSKNVIEKIGDMLFVHGGISAELMQSELTLKNINEIVREMLSKNYALAPPKDKDIELINGRMGPLWYRGMAVDHGKRYNKATPEEVQKVLSRFDVKHVVIGHTPMRQMQTDFDGGVVKINLLQPRAKFTGRAKAFLVEDGVFYSVTDLGVKAPLD